MHLNRTRIVGIAALALAACSGDGSSGRSAAKISEIDWTLQQSGTTTIGITAIEYQGDEVKDVTFRKNGAPAGRMELSYTGGKIHAIDLTDAQGDRGTYAWSYTNDRLTSILWSVPLVVSHEQKFEYDDAAHGRPRRATSTTTWENSSPSSMVETYDYDDSDRLVKSTAVEGTSTSSSEIRYDQDSRIERFTEYAGGSFIEDDLTYDDQGRVSLIESTAGQRYEISYADDGQIDEILLLDPSNGQTLTVTYRYVPGNVAGMTFDPNLPANGLIDLRGQTFDQAVFTAYAPPLELADVPAAQNTSSCAHDVCVAGTALSASCDACATVVCSADSYCCTTSWDSTCVGSVATECGITC